MPLAIIKETKREEKKSVHRESNSRGLTYTFVRSGRTDEQATLASLLNRDKLYSRAINFSRSFVAVRVKGMKLFTREKATERLREKSTKRENWIFRTVWSIRSSINIPKSLSSSPSLSLLSVSIWTWTIATGNSSDRQWKLPSVRDEVYARAINLVKVF